MDANAKTLLNVGGAAAIVYLVATAHEATVKLKADVEGFISHPGEDAALDYFALWDIQNRIATLGLADTTWAASFYAWLHQLTPEQQQAVKDAEANGGLGKAASATFEDLKAGLSASTHYGLAAIIGWGLFLLNTTATKGGS